MKKKISILLTAAMLLTLPGFSAAADPMEPAVQTASEEISDTKKTDNQSKEETKEQADPSEKEGNEEIKEEEKKEGETSAEEEKTSEEEKISEEEIIEVLPEAAVAAEVIAAVSEEETKKAYEEAKQNQEKLEAALDPYASKADFYDDVYDDSGFWYRPGAGYTFSKGIITGMGDNIFAATLNICKAQFITILYRMDGAPNTPFVQNFYDVPDGQFYSSAVTWGVNNNIIDAGEYFGPADDLPRAGMVEMMYRFAKYKGLEGTDLTIDLAYQYEDAGNVEEYASQAFQWAVRRGIISGTDATHLSPLVTCNRAEVATIIARYCESYFPGQLPDVTFDASVSDITVTGTSTLYGVFKVQVDGVQATHKIKGVKAQVWLQDDYSDLKWVDLYDQGNGTYSVDCWLQYWDNQKGVYKAQIFVYLENGLRFWMGSSWGYADVMHYQVRDICLKIYNEVGWDLYACYKWCVNNITFTWEDPNGWGWAIPEYFTFAEWHAITAYNKRKGCCNNYASLFFELAKGMGYPAQLIKGEVPLATGGNSEHGWVMINGLYYDPDLEHEKPTVSAYAFPYGTQGTYVYSNAQVIEE